MPVGCHYGVQRLIGDDLEKSGTVIGGVDEYAAAAAVLQQVGIVVERSDADLRQSHRAGEAQYQRRATWFDMVDAKILVIGHQYAGSRRPSPPLIAEASVLPSSQPRRLALLPLIVTGSPALPTAVMTPESEFS